VVEGDTLTDPIGAVGRVVIVIQDGVVALETNA
jgi:hypothetical protein